MGETKTCIEIGNRNGDNTQTAQVTNRYVQTYGQTSVQTIGTRQTDKQIGHKLEKQWKEDRDRYTDRQVMKRLKDMDIETQTDIDAQVSNP